MTRKLHIQRIIDTLISLEKTTPLNVVIDADLGLLRWGLFLKTHLELQKENLHSSSDSQLKLIGLHYGNIEMKDARAALYDEVLEHQIVDYIEFYNTQFDVLMLLTGYPHKIILDDLKRILNAAKVGVILNLNESILEMPLGKNENISTLKSLNGSFDFIEVANKVFFFKRKFQISKPIYLFDTVVGEDNSIALVASSSVVEYLIPINSSFVKINFLKHPWSGEVAIYVDGTLVNSEVLESSKTITDFITIIKLPSNDKKQLSFKSLHSPERLGNEVWIREVQFS